MLKSINDVEKEILEILQYCVNCKFCTTVCPLYEEWLRESAFGKIFSIYYILKYDIPLEDTLRNIIWYCTTCGKCEYLCKDAGGGIKVVDIVENARRILLHKYHFKPIERHTEVLNDVLNYYNPYHVENVKRWDWLPFSLPSKGEYLYFVGCTAAFRMQNVAKATVEVLNRLNVNLAKFTREKCCGSVILRTGFIEEAIKIMEENYKNINSSGSKYLITSCAGCYRTLKKDYPKIVGDLDVEVLHSSELLEKLLNEGKLKLNTTALKGLKITYHDPCHLGRHAEVYDAPRSILSSIPGIEFVEMPNSRENSNCCGAGGGFRSGFTSKSLELALKRIYEAKETGADILVTCCPFCELNLKQVAKERNIDLKIMDLMELILQIV